MSPSSIASDLDGVTGILELVEVVEAPDKSRRFFILASCVWFPLRGRHPWKSVWVLGVVSPPDKNPREEPTEPLDEGVSGGLE